MRPDTSTPVLVLGIENYGALGALRSLGRWGVHLYGVDVTRHSPVAASRYCRGVFVWDFDAAPPHASVEFLLKTAREIGGRPVLLATSDAMALFVAEHAAVLEQVFRFPQTPFDTIRAFYNKREMYTLAKTTGIPTARCVFPQSRHDVAEFARSAQFPLVLKAIDGVSVFRRTGRKTAIARSPDKLLAQYDAMDGGSPAALMVQEYIPGRPDANWMFNGYFDRHSNCLFGITGRKIHKAPPYTGMTALGVCQTNPTVWDLTLTLMKTARYRGILDIGYMFDMREGTYKVHDVNPRVGVSFRLFVGSGGMDVVRAAYLDLTGQSVPPSDICEGRKWVVEHTDPISSWRYLRDGTQTFREWLASYSGLQEGAWFAADDLRPFFRMGGRISAWAWRSIACRLTKRPAPGRTPVALLKD